jgi:hypothetical protein
MSLLSLNKPSTEIFICGDFNTDCLLSCNNKQKLPLLLGAYNILHKVDCPVRFQNGLYSATDNIFVDKSRMQLYEIFPLSSLTKRLNAQY